jgi:aspartyl-tRNA(Asn)/glutamyl-tRNA(Gln) amidotransferase subunit C
VALTDDDVRQVATLARLALTDDEVAQCREQLDQVLGYMERLAAVDVEGVEPAPYPFDTVMPLRADELVPGLSNEQLMELAPESEDGQLAVPKVVG